MKLTPNQTDAMLSLNQYEGQTVEVLTSGYVANVAPEAVRSAVATVSSAALRGLEAKGLVKIVDAYWKGARVAVLKAYDFVAESRAAREAAPPVVLARAAMSTPIVARMARYEAAYQACHGRTVSVTWSGENVRVLEHGADPAYALHMDADELDAIAARMEAKVAALAASRAAAAVRVRDDGFENLDDIFAELEATAIAEAKAEAAAEAEAFAALSPEGKAAETAARAARVEALGDIFDADDEEPDEDSDDADDDADADEEGSN
jgi:hypothetical protein